LRAANPGLDIWPVSDVRFARYGRVLQGYDPAEMIQRAKALLPDSQEVVYETSVRALEEPSALNEAIGREVYGGMPFQVGWCYGRNSRLDALEYHKGAETVVCLTDVVLLLGHVQDIVFGEEIVYDTNRVVAFYAPKGSVLELPAWNLHFAPIHVREEEGFATLVYLPKGTNEPLPYSVSGQGESALLFAVNKWLIAHPEAEELAAQGAYVGMVGPNIRVRPL
ncbi:MAG: DUF4867 family protein, partial [Anaerolineae bacterium]|nr:DUF4867 family protein [Anaerolineae bacterium]